MRRDPHISYSTFLTPSFDSCLISIDSCYTTGVSVFSSPLIFLSLRFYCVNVKAKLASFNARLHIAAASEGSLVILSAFIHSSIRRLNCKRTMSLSCFCSIYSHHGNERSICIASSHPVLQRRLCSFINRVL